MRKNTEVSFILIIFLYMVIYNPPIFTINCIRVIMVPCWIYLYLNRKVMREFINLKKVITVELIITMLFAYCIIISFINSNAPTNFAYLFYWIAGDIPFAISVWIYLRKKNQGFQELLVNIIVTSIVMSITAIMALISPEIKSFFTERMIVYGVQYADRLAVYRNYGFAANLTAFASMLQAVLSVVCIFQAVKGEKKYLLVFPLLILSAIINTRSSILFLLSGIFIILLITLRSRFAVTYILRYVIIIAVLFAISGFGFSLIQYYNEQTLTWLNVGLDSILSFVSGNDRSVGYFGELETMVFNSIPTSFNLLMGVGSGVMGDAGAVYGARSDVGFINDLWRGGLLYSTTIICLYLVMLKQIYKSKILDQDYTKFFSLYFFLIFILTNIKGSFFIHSDLTVVFWLFYTAFVFNSINQEKFRVTIGFRR